jgi:hypothetical protein
MRSTGNCSAAARLLRLSSSNNSLGGARNLAVVDVRSVIQRCFSCLQRVCTSVLASSMYADSIWHQLLLLLLQSAGAVPAGHERFRICIVPAAPY